MKALVNISQGFILGIMLSGQIEDGWVFHPFRAPIFFMVIVVIVLSNWPKKTGA